MSSRSSRHLIKLIHHCKSGKMVTFNGVKTAGCSKPEIRSDKYYSQS